MNDRLRDFLNAKVEQYNQPSFIKDDPICIPHLFTKKQDIEIAAFFAAIFAWGNRTTIILKCRELMQRMDMAPYDFCTNSDPKRLRQLASFKHRTFNETDLLYFVEFFQYHYAHHDSLESAFVKQKITFQPAAALSKTTGSKQTARRQHSLNKINAHAGDTKNAIHGNNPDLISKNQKPGQGPAPDPVERALNNFYEYFFSLEDVPYRTRKHIASPEKKSTCKRLNMFLRWMVRKDNKGVDFGLWNQLSPSMLICPIDLHVARVARRFNLIQRKQLDWLTAVELTSYLRTLDSNDPVKYDFALFALGVMEKF